MKDPRDVIIAPVVREKSLRLLEHERLHVRRPPRRHQDRDPRRRRGDLRRARSLKVNTLNRKGKRKRNRRTGTFGKRPTPSGPSSPSPRATASTCSRAERHMALRKRKPTSPGRRFQTVSDFSEITKTDAREVAARPQAQAPAAATTTAARPPATRAAATSSSTASSTSSATKDGVPAKVAAIEYDPNRNGRIALLHYHDGEKRYILAPARREGRRPAAERPGRGDPSRQRPAAALHPRRLHRPQRRAQARRRRQDGPRRRHRASSWWPRRATSPPCACPRTEMRRVPIDCRATVGEVGNAEAELIKIGKAGRNRWKGVRPQTRGVAMNPVDHPLGGGEGKTSGGRHPVSPWGKPEGRTRDKTKPSQKLIVRRRRTRGAPEVGRHMPRSLKKGPFVDDHLLKKVDDLNASRARRGSSRPGPAAPRSSPTWSATPSPSTTAASTCPCTSPSRWSATSSASSRPPAPSGSTPARRSKARAAMMAFGSQDQRAPGHPGPGHATSGCRPTRSARSSTSSAASTSPRPTRSSQFAERDVAIVDPQGAARRPSPTPSTTTSQDPEELFVSACFADEGPTLKRWRPRARGRATRIRKRTCHITVIVSRLPDERARASAPSATLAAAGVGGGRPPPRPAASASPRSRQAEAERRPPRPTSHDHDHDHEGHDHDRRGRRRTRSTTTSRSTSRGRRRRGRRGRRGRRRRRGRRGRRPRPPSRDAAEADADRATRPTTPRPTRRRTS